MVDKVVTRQNGRWKMYTPVTVSAGAADAGKIPALGANGKIDGTMVDLSGVQTGGNTRAIIANEALTAGNFVNIFLNGGTLNVRLADNTNNRPAHGFVKAAAGVGVQATVYELDAINDQLTGLNPGNDYYLGTAGGVITAPLDPATATSGYLDQKLGIALSATELKTDDFPVVVM